MRTSTFLNTLRHDDISAAIREAELRTSGEIRVFISRNPVAEPIVAAQAEFVRLGMTQTRERNGVLIFVAPKSQTFAVIGDLGIHDKCGDTFWEELALAMAGEFRESRFTEGIRLGIQRAGELLARQFPRQPDDHNELPDTVVRD